MYTTNVSYNDASTNVSNSRVLILADLFPDECKHLVVAMFGHVFPALALLVTGCNLVVVAVFLKPKIRSHTSFMLTLIALSDVLNILCPTTVYVYFYAVGEYKYPVPFKLCRWAYYFGTVFRDMFNSFSLWLTVTLAYIRTRCITSPFTACEVHNRKNIALAITAIVVLVVTIHAPSLFAYHFTRASVSLDDEHVTYESCHVTMSDFLDTGLLKKVHMWLEVVFSSLLPCALLVYLTISMLISLKRAKKDRDSLQNYNMSTPCNSRQNSNGIKHAAVVKETICNGHDDLDNEQKQYDEQINECGLNAEPLHRDTTVECENLKSGKSKTVIRNSFHKVSGLLTNKLKSVHDGHRSRDRVMSSGSQRSRDSAFERLNRESRRTSWYILLVISMICSHELPLAGLYTHTLITHRGRLPPVVYGCSTMALLLWQYVTYSLIFLIYCCMCQAFRTELRRTLSCGGGCGGRMLWQRGGGGGGGGGGGDDNGDGGGVGEVARQSLFTNHCSVRRHLQSSKTTIGDNSEGRLFIQGDEDNHETF